MRYLQSFYRRLRQIRESAQLTREDIASICSVDEATVAGWEDRDTRRRAYPGVTELLDFCLRTDTALDEVLDLDDTGDTGQLELPGLTFSRGDDLSTALKQLEQEIQRVQLSDEEAELLRRFRKTSAENRRMVLQILGR
jgi:transcriptional regulator with XRE-family HTH domain